MNFKPFFLWICFAALTGLLVVFSAAGCSCGDDDDDDNNDDYGNDDDDDDDNDTGDDDDNDDNDTLPPDTNAPVITGTTDLDNTIDETGPYLIETTVNDDVGVDEVFLHYRIDDGPVVDEAMTPTTKDGLYTAEIPGQAAGSSIHYYIRAADVADNEATDPPDAPTDVYGFSIGVTEELYTDDGDSGVAWSAYPTYGDGSIIAKRLMPSTYTSYLAEVSVGVTTNGGGAVEYEVVIFADETGDNPNDSTEIWSSGNIVAIPSAFPYWDWQTFDVTTELADESLSSGNWLVGVRFHSLYLFFVTDETFSGVDSNVVVFDPGSTAWTGVGGLGSYTGTQIARAIAYHF